jgi:hypothetical protein
MTEREDMDARLARLRSATQALELPAERVARMLLTARTESVDAPWSHAMLSGGRRALLLVALVPVLIALWALQVRDSVDEGLQYIGAVEWMP